MKKILQLFIILLLLAFIVFSYINLNKIWRKEMKKEEIKETIALIELAKSRLILAGSIQDSIMISREENSITELKNTLAYSNYKNNIILTKIYFSIIVFSIVFIFLLIRIFE